MDGKIIIGTEIDNKEFDKQIKSFNKNEIKLKDKKLKLELDNQKAVNNLKKVEDQIDIVEKKIQNMVNVNLPENLINNVEYEKLTNQWEQLNDKASEYTDQIALITNKIKQLEKQITEEKFKPVITPDMDMEDINETVKRAINDAETSLDNYTSAFENAMKNVKAEGIEDFISSLENVDSTNLVVAQDKFASSTENLTFLLGELLKEYNELQKSDIVFEKDRKDAELLKQKIIEVTTALEKLTGEKITIKGINDINLELDNVGTKLKGILKTVAKWGLAVFGVRTAYNAIRNVISTLSQYNPQLSADIEYIRYALATTLQPVIERLINLVKTLLQYIGYIAKAWFGVNIFANASAKAMNKAVKGAKQLNKQLAGFDEMNVLSDSSSSGGGATAPSFDLSSPDDVEPPAWLVWIAENKELILGVLAGIALGLLAIKLADPTTWIVLAIAAIAGLIAVIVANWEKIKGVLITVGTWIYDNVIKPVVDFFVGLWNKIVEIFTPVIEFFKSIFTTVWENIKITINNIVQIYVFLWNKIKEIFGPVVEWFRDKFDKAKEAIKKVFSPIIDFFSQLWSKVKDKLKAFGTKVGEVVGSAFKTVFNGIMTSIETFLNTPIKAINKLIKVINEVPGINLGKLETFKLPRLAQGGIVNHPGNGVMMGSYVAGERGPEAVIPLDDATLDRLGLAFARHTTINATIPVYAYNRQVAREIRKIEAEQNFATNRS